MEYYSALEKEGNPVICDNMDKVGGHYAKWNKPDTQKANAVWSHLYVYKISRIGKSIETESSLMVARDWGQRSMGNDCLMGVGDEDSLELDSSDGCTAL